MKLVLAAVAILVACGNSEQTRPAAGSAPVAKPEAVTAKLVGCAPALPRPVDPRELVLTGDRPPPRTTNVPHVTFGKPSITGNLTEPTIRAGVRTNSARFQYCFEKQLQINPRLTGGVVETSFAIQSNGAVASAHADGIEAEVSLCIARSLEMLAFPRPADGNQVQVTYPITIEYQPDPSSRSAPRVRTLREWTPFAATETIVASPDSAKAVADAVTKVAASRMAAVEQCFDGARGAVRSVIAIDANGSITAMRTGGIGESAIETCISTALGAFSVPAPPVDVEIACDFTRGADAPFRVSPDAGYSVIELTDHEARNRSSVRELPPRGSTRGVTSLASTAAVLVLAEPDAPPNGIDYALWWAPPGNTLVAVKASGGAPVLLGMGDSRAERAPVTTKRIVQLRTDKGKLSACIANAPPIAKTATLLAPREMDAVLADLVAECARTPCEPTIIVGTSGDFIAKDLVATTSAARRAGFTSVSIGGPACD